MLAPNQPGDPIPLLEALYDLERPRQLWFHGVLQAAGNCLDRGRGVGMVLYDVSGPQPIVEAIDGWNIAPENLKLGAAVHSQPGWEDGILSCYRSVLCATLNEHVPDVQQRTALRALYRPLGVRDQILINGANRSGIGCGLYVFSGTALRLRASERRLLTRIATHLSTAYRLLRRLERPVLGSSGTAVAAILDANGQLKHAESTASSRESRHVLTEAVKSREWARTLAGRADPQRATGAWKPLVVGRWSLVDCYERDGRRYLTACENTPAPIDLEVLSPRELQVVALAELGRSNKLIAYELGLADSTVRVLLARAASKVGARTRVALIARFRELHQVAIGQA